MSIEFNGPMFKVESGTGYKLVQTDGKGKYLSWDHIPNKGFEYQTDGWQQDTNKRDGPNNGFHILLGRPYFNYSLPDWDCFNGFHATIIEVEFKDVITCGYADSYFQRKDYRAVVAKSIRFIREVPQDEQSS